MPPSGSFDEGQKNRRKDNLLKQIDYGIGKDQEHADYR